MELILDLAAEHVPATLLRQQRLAVLVGDEVGEVDVPAGLARFGAHTFAAQLVGTTDDEAQTFTWAWAAEVGAIPDDVLVSARGMREYGLANELAEFTEAVWSVHDVNPFLLAAIARGWAHADALYRFPMLGGAMYVLLGGVQLPPIKPQAFVQALTTGIALAPMDHRQATVALCRDAGVSTTGMDDIVVVTIGTTIVTVAFTDTGRIANVETTSI